MTYLEGKWPELQAAELERRKAKQAAAAAAKQPFRNKKPEASNSHKDSGYSGNQQQWKQNQPAYNQEQYAQNKQSSQPHKDRKPDNCKDKKRSGGGRGGRWRCLSIPEASPAGVGRLSSFQPPLETGDARPMGASNSPIRILVGIHQYPTSVPVSEHYTSQEHRQKIHTHRGDQAASPKEHHQEEKIHPQQVCFLSSFFLTTKKPCWFKMESLAVVPQNSRKAGGELLWT